MYDRNIFKVGKISHKIPTIPSTRASASQCYQIILRIKFSTLSVMQAFRRNNLNF